MPNVKVVNVYTNYNITTCTCSTAWVCVLIALIDMACAHAVSLLLFRALGRLPKVKIEQCVPHAAGNTHDWQGILLYVCSVEL